MFEAPDYKGSEKLLDKAAIVTGGDSGIGRAVAVLFAREGADVAVLHLAEERDARETLAAIAHDEAGHADLAWEIVAWCCDQSGVELHRALRQTLRAAPQPDPWWNVSGDLVPELTAHGWPGSDAWPALVARTRQEVADRLEQLVFRHDHPERT